MRQTETPRAARSNRSGRAIFSQHFSTESPHRAPCRTDFLDLMDRGERAACSSGFPETGPGGPPRQGPTPTPDPGRGVASATNRRRGRRHPRKPGPVPQRRDGGGRGTGPVLQGLALVAEDFVEHGHHGPRGAVGDRIVD